jgi:hypothetical protein
MLTRPRLRSRTLRSRTRGQLVRAERACTALAGAWSDCDIYIGSEFRIDVSSEAGSRFDQNVTGFRAEEEFGFNAEAYVRTGKFVKILGL